jgi:hypothetical protein
MDKEMSRTSFNSLHPEMDIRERGDFNAFKRGGDP